MDNKFKEALIETLTGKKINKNKSNEDQDKLDSEIEIRYEEEEIWFDGGYVTWFRPVEYKPIKKGNTN